MHEKIVFFEWPKWTDCTDFFKFDQKIARNVQLMFQIVRIFRIFSQQKTFFFSILTEQKPIFAWELFMKIFFKKSVVQLIFSLFSSFRYIGLIVISIAN